MLVLTALAGGLVGYLLGSRGGEGGAVVAASTAARETPPVATTQSPPATPVAPDPAAPAPAPAAPRDDTAWLQSRLDGGGRIFLPRLPDGACYATRGLWVSTDGTAISSDGACLSSLGVGPVRLSSEDGDPIPASAVLFVNRSSTSVPAPTDISIAGLRIVVPAGVPSYGIAVFGQRVDVRDVVVEGSPIDALLVGGRANGEGFARTVSVTDSQLSGGMRNVVSVTGVVGLTLERNLITAASDTNPLEDGGQAFGNPSAGVDLEPDTPGSPILDVRIAGNEISANAGPGLLFALETNAGLPTQADRIEVVGNRIVDNGRKATPPVQGGIVFAGGQADGQGHALVTGNVIRGNQGAGVQGKPGEGTTMILDVRGNDVSANSGGVYSFERLGAGSYLE